MRTRLLILLLPALALPAGAQDNTDIQKKRVLHQLASRQKRAAGALEDQLASIRTLKQELEKAGETDKAVLLQKAVDIVTKKQIGVSKVAKAEGGHEEILGDLEHAMNEMARMLAERPDATEEVQRLGLKVVEALGSIIQVLTGEDEIKSLEQREKMLRDIRAEADRLARQQAELRRETRTVIPRTEAEKAAGDAARELERLAREVRDLDRQARDDLEAVDRAREYAARVKDILQRQQRLRNETAVRAGRADKLSPQVNRLAAELEALARSARKAETEAARQDALAELARDVRNLADRQAKIEAEIRARAALERALDALRRGEQGEPLKKALEEAAQAAPEAEALALKRAAREPEDAEALQDAAAAIRGALERMASAETLARDEQALARDVERALMRAADAGQAKMNEAIAKAKKAAEELAQGRTGELEAREATEALKEAHAALAAAAKAAADPAAAQRRAEERALAAARATKAAAELEALAEDKETRNAGMSGTAREAADAARRAAEEMKRAAEAARQNAPERARQNARSAAERLENAMNELREGLREGHDLLERQGNVAEDLQNLAESAPGEAGDGLKQAARKAEQAKDEIRTPDYKAANRTQEEVLKQLDELSRQAEAKAQETARTHQQALDRATQATKRAADRAQRIAGQLNKGARAARENDARRRMEQAEDQTKQAEEALRRSLRRLSEAMPKSAEQDRKEALEKIENARRSLRGLRESHSNPGARQREQLQKISDRQQKLEDEVRKLEDRMKRLKEPKGREQLQDAQSAMREAARRLRDGEPDEAERAQERAEKALKQMQKELDEEERRYRALRQYELLFKLKQELEGFRRTSQGHREWLMKIDEMVRRDGKVTRYVRKNEINKLRAQLKTLFKDVGEKADAVGKEGAVVYTYILKGASTDLQEVEAQLALKEVGLVPQELLGDVVRRFDLAIKGLERDLRERNQQQQQQQQQGQQQGNVKPRLVPPDAEIRMVMVLQKSLNEEREGFFEARPAFGQRQPTPGEKARVERLYHQQGSLAELFDDLREAFRRQDEDEPEFPPGEGPGPGGPDEEENR